MSKVLYLDIDGVLNSEDHRDHVIGGIIWIQPWHVKYLNMIVDGVDDLLIVLSSSWRLYYRLDEVQQFLEDEGFKGKLHDATTYGYRTIGANSQRGQEIALWLAHNGKDVDKFVIVDDDDDLAPLMDHWVHSTHQHGLTESKALDIIDKLNSTRD